MRTLPFLPAWLGGSGGNNSAPGAQAFRPLPTSDQFDEELDTSAEYNDEYDQESSYRQHSRGWCPEENAGFVSRLLFLWVGGLLTLGAQKTLEHDDLWDIAENDKASRVSAAFKKHLRGTSDDMAAPQGRVGRAMWRAHGRSFTYAGVVKLIHDAVMFTGPFLLEVLLKHVQAGGGGWKGFGLACALGVAAVVETLTVNVYFHTLFRICLHLKTELVDMLYGKSLKISAAAKSEMGTGAVVNLQSNDAAKLWSLPQYLYVLIRYSLRHSIVKMQ